MNNLRRGEIPQPSSDHPTGFSLTAQRRKVAVAYLRLTDLLGVKLDGVAAVELADQLCSVVKLEGLEARHALEFSMQHLHGLVLDEGTLHGFLSWVMENRDYLARGEGIPLWTGEPPVWACLRVIDGVVEKIRDVQILRLVLKSYSGVTAGNYIELRVSPKYTRWLVKEMGYPKYGRAHELEIVGSVFWGLLGAGQSACLTGNGQRKTRRIAGTPKGR
jgi:hypothetical protein